MWSGPPLRMPRPPIALVAYSAPHPHPGQPALELPAEHRVLGPSFRLRPERGETADETGDPIRRLRRLVPVTFQLERRFDQLAARVDAVVHPARRFGQQLRP